MTVQNRYDLYKTELQIELQGVPYEHFGLGLTRDSDRRLRQTYSKYLVLDAYHGNIDTLRLADFSNRVVAATTPTNIR